jgi:hypothetical protein
VDEEWQADVLPYDGRLTLTDVMLMINHGHVLELEIPQHLIAGAEDGEDEQEEFERTNGILRMEKKKERLWADLALPS